MTEILPSASYRRSSAIRSAAHSRSALLSIGERHKLESTDTTDRIWELLETPQTITSICRVLAAESGGDPGVRSPQVAAFLAELYRDDLIELSPDT